MKSLNCGCVNLTGTRSTEQEAGEIRTALGESQESGKLLTERVQSDKGNQGDRMKCPLCKLENPEIARICDCGYLFATGSAPSVASIELAIIKAEAQLSGELDTMALIPETKMSQYLKNNSLSDLTGTLAELTGTLAETTKQRLRDAITLAVRKNGTADDIVEAIRATVKDFSSVQAEMIAQTELNNAYNFGRTELARSAGFTEKRWVTESGNPCTICILNEAEGYIGMDEPFLSGHQRPTAHASCCCSLDFRQVKF